MCTAAETVVTGILAVGFQVIRPAPWQSQILTEPQPHPPLSIEVTCSDVILHFADREV